MERLLQIPTMLISDDDRDLRESLAQVFSGAGFRTFLAEDGQRALDVMLGHDVHLAIIDFHMPRMTGLEALRRIKQRRSRLPVIMMSAQLDDPLRDQIIAAQAYSVHRKPISLSHLRADVSAALRQIYGWAMDS